MAENEWVKSGCAKNGIGYKERFTPMNKYLSAAIAASLLATPTVLRADDALTSDKDKVSYSIGVDMGRSLSKQGVDVNTDVLISGIKDAVGGGSLKMTDADMQTTMQTFMQAMQAKMQARQQAWAASHAQGTPQ